MEFMPKTSGRSFRAANLLLALSEREREDVDQRIDDAYNHPDNSRETLRAVCENGGNSGGPSRPFRPVGRGYDSSPESFRASIVNFNGRAAKFA